MISLGRPNGSVRESVRACAGSIQNKDLAIRLISTEEHLVAAEKLYKAHAEARTLYQLPESAAVAGTVTLEEMKTLYKGTFAKLGSSCRYLYDKIKISAKICPLCNSRTVSTLDHYLAQAFYPEFVLTPSNLVPACEKCNKDKHAASPKVAEEQTLHPYFDVIPNDQPWLFAEVIVDDPVAVIFKAIPPKDWDPLLSARISKHFRGFHLAELYAAKASSELSEISVLMEMEYMSHGSAGLKEYLLIQASARRSVAPHSWMPALYQALAESDWFINGGFSKV